MYRIKKKVNWRLRVEGNIDINRHTHSCFFLSVPTNLYRSHVKTLFCTDAWQIQIQADNYIKPLKNVRSTHTSTRDYSPLPTDTLSFTAKFVIGRYSGMTSRSTLPNSETPLSAGGEGFPQTWRLFNPRVGQVQNSASLFSLSLTPARSLSPSPSLSYTGTLCTIAQCL